MVKDFLVKLKNLIKFGVVTGGADNASQFPVQQMVYKGKVVNALQIFPYGLYANNASDDSLGVIFSIDDNENNRAALCFTPKRRPTDLEQNEVAFYHPFTNSFIKFRNNGNLEIDTGEGNIVIDSTNITVNCNTATVAGDVVINGDLTVTGATTLSATVTSNGKDISDTHTHIGSATAPDGPQVDTGVPN